MKFIFSARPHGSCITVDFLPAREDPELEQRSYAGGQLYMDLSVWTALKEALSQSPDIEVEEFP